MYIVNNLRSYHKSQSSYIFSDILAQATRHDKLLQHFEASISQLKKQNKELEYLKQLYVNTAEMSTCVAQIAKSINRITEEIKELTSATDKNTSRIHSLVPRRLVDSV